MYVKELKYLGVHVSAGLCLKFSVEHLRSKFYRTFNCIYSKSKASNSEMVTVDLLKSLKLIADVSYSNLLLVYGFNSLYSLYSVFVCMCVCVSVFYWLHLLRNKLYIATVRSQRNRDYSLWPVTLGASAAETVSRTTSRFGMAYRWSFL